MAITILSRLDAEVPAVDASPEHEALRKSATPASLAALLGSHAKNRAAAIKRVAAVDAELIRAARRAKATPGDVGAALDAFEDLLDVLSKEQ